MENLLFSVIIPIYKVEDCLRKCVDSVLAQTFSDFEIILVDDGSPDGCPELCDQYAKNDNRIHVIHKKNGGLVSARNAGIKQASGQYILYVDGDDWIKENLLETMYQIVREQKKPDIIVFNAIYEYGSHQKNIPCYVKSGYYSKKQLEKKIYPYMIYDASLPFFTGKVFPAAWNKIYKKELLSEHYCRDERISLAEDNAFVYECLYYADTAYFCGKHLYFYNKCNENSMVSMYNKNYFEKSLLMCRYLTKRLKGKHSYLDRQIQVFRTAWLIMAVFHEVRFCPVRRTAIHHIKEKIGKSNFLKGCTYRFLPLLPKIYLFLLKMHCYQFVWLASKILVKSKDNK